MNTAALIDNDGNLIGGLEAFQDVSHLKALEREKDNFISMIAHDMRSSLLVIGGFILRLLNKAADTRPEKQQKYLAVKKNISPSRRKRMDIWIMALLRKSHDRIACPMFLKLTR